MASIRRRVSANGKKSFCVTWRDGDGRQRTETTTDPKQAEKIKKRAETHGKNADLQGFVRGTASKGSRHTDKGFMPADIAITNRMRLDGKYTIETYSERFMTNHRVKRADAGLQAQGRQPKVDGCDHRQRRRRFHPDP